MKTIADPEARAGLLARLERLTPDASRRWGTLTPGEVLCHLADAAYSVLDVDGDDEPARRKTLVKWLGLYLPLPWPHGVKTVPELDPKTRGTRPTEFEEDRRRVIRSLDDLVSAERLASSHRIFGAMSRSDWHRWAYRHTDHHLRQFGL